MHRVYEATLTVDNIKTSSYTTMLLWQMHAAGNNRT